MTLCDRLVVSASSSSVTTHLSLAGEQEKDIFILHFRPHTKVTYTTAAQASSGSFELDKLAK